MKAIDRVTGHFERASNRKIEVPEWGEDGNPFIVYASPMTPYQRKKIRAENEDIDAGAHVDILIMKACDEHGSHLFTDDDRHKLLTKADGAIVGRIAIQILTPAKLSDLEKN